MTARLFSSAEMRMPERDAAGLSKFTARLGTCDVPYCGRPVQQIGLCAVHFIRAFRLGSASQRCSACGRRPATVRAWCRSCYDAARWRGTVEASPLRHPNEPDEAVRAEVLAAVADLKAKRRRGRA